jgi:1-acyl-sn-glycerol-3-phosphate acyltransferase
MRGAWYDFVRWFVRNTFFRATGGLKGIGRENVPKQGGVIIAPYHVSNLDPPAVACTCPRRLNFMAKEELFKVPILGPIIRSLDAFPLKRGEGDTEAIRHAISQLEAGKTIIIFPEGSRGDGISIQPLTKGATLLARKTGATVVPVGIVGSHKVLPKGQSKPKRGKIVIAYGQPFTYADIEKQHGKAAKDAFGVELQKRILALCRENGLPLKSEPSSQCSEGSHPTETPV